MIDVEKSVINKKFGKLLALSESTPRKDKRGKKHRQILCKCDCGNEVSVDLRNLISGNSTSCGICNRPNRARKHGMKGTRIYNIWKGIKTRCYNEKCHNYSDYGGRGIKMAQEWVNNFDAFYNWSMENNYDDTLTIDRIDNSGNYEPDNCRWVPKSTQSRNRRGNIMIDGKCLAEICRERNLKYDTIRCRIKYYGYTIEEALNLPIED